MKLWYIRSIILVTFTSASVFAAYLQRGARAAQQVTRSVSTTPISQYSTMAVRRATSKISPTQTGQASIFSTSSNPVAGAYVALQKKRMSHEKDSDQGWWQQERVKDAIKQALGITGVVAIAAVISEARKIAHSASEIIVLDMLDENLLPDEFSPAIVKIYGKYRCSGVIVASEKNPGLYFVVTAAHCLSSEDGDYVEIKHPHYSDPDKDIMLILTKIFIDPSTDVAIFLIPSYEIRYFEDETGTALPAIPAKQLSSIAPRPGEVVLLQGYPKDTPLGNAYKEKFLVQGPTNAYQKKLSVTELITIEKDFLPSKSGASGAPYLVVRDNRLEVQGIHSGGLREALGKKKVSYAGGFGKLSHYLKEAEQNANEPEAAEQIVKEQIKELAKNKPWYRKLFGF